MIPLEFCDPESILKNLIYQNYFSSSKKKNIVLSLVSKDFNETMDKKIRHDCKLVSDRALVRWRRHDCKLARNITSLQTFIKCAALPEVSRLCRLCEKLVDLEPKELQYDDFYRAGRGDWGTWVRLQGACQRIEDKIKIMVGVDSRDQKSREIKRVGRC